MTLEEAIKHCDEVANEKYIQGMLCHANPNDEYLDSCIECAKQHEQLKLWLMELNNLKNPQPYKLEDLKPNMWVWDDVNKDCRQIAKINEYGGIYWYGSLSEYEVDKFEENRFYPVTKALEYQVGVD